MTAVPPSLPHIMVKRKSRSDAPFPKYDYFPEHLHSHVRPWPGPKYCSIRPNFNRFRKGLEGYPPAKFQVDCSRFATRSVSHSEVRKMSENREKGTLPVFRSDRFSIGSDRSTQG